ncbi:MAG: ankyrin repeat domain-containing protein [Armatimonadetes bacterium]|nr:ankyrin repeat domain-containing protein [Armatimonadota bacterium]MDE2205263.1 ankyrin repeat domain-containing protein [Armatimonadota bacterium]
MALRHFPVRPDLELLTGQAGELLSALHNGDAAAAAEFRQFHPDPVAAQSAQMVDAQLALARSYGLPSWQRLVTACRLTDAIWRGDAETVRTLVLQYPELITEDARGVKGNWGPPMSYAANIGQDSIIRMLRELGAEDVQSAFERACLQGKLDTARMLVDMGARIQPGVIMGPCETQSGSGLELLLELGADFSDAAGDRAAPVALILETYCRNPEGKHRCLELAAAHGAELPDSAPMALHRGRLDLLERHLARDPAMLTRTFTHEEIYPPEVGCHEDVSLALCGTELAGGTLLHLCVDYDELEIANWLLDHGADANAPAAVDSDGFGGHTPLFNCVVSQAYLAGIHRDGTWAQLILDHGADPNAVASLRKRLRFVEDETMHLYHNVKPISYGQRFHERRWVCTPALDLIAAHGGTL